MEILKKVGWVIRCQGFTKYPIYQEIGQKLLHNYLTHYNMEHCINIQYSSRTVWTEAGLGKWSPLLIQLIGKLWEKYQHPLPLHPQYPTFIINLPEKVNSGFLPAAVEHIFVCVSASNVVLLLLRAPVWGSKSPRQFTPEYDMENLANFSSSDKSPSRTSAEIQFHHVKHHQFIIIW